MLSEKMLSGLLSVYVILAGLFLEVSSSSRPSTIVIENNQYKNVVIAIHESVAEDKNLITTLKETVNKASGILFKATRKRAYFKEVTILLPSTWSNDASYASVTTETVNVADVIITDTVRSTRSLPQSRSYSGCGKQGIHVLLPKDFLSNPRAEPYYTFPEKYFIHAFAQFRWGVYQEYAETGESAFYFSLSSGHPEAIRCVYYLRGLIQKDDANHTICYNAIDKETGLYTPDCLWRPYPTRQRVKASMMDHQWITAIETFCDDDTHGYLTVHNYEAPSKHNRLCSHRSTWDVITNSDDFINGKNPPISTITPTDLLPTYKIVRASSRKKRAVIVIDDEIKNRESAHIDTTLGRLHHEVNVNGIDTTTLLASEFTRALDGKNSEEILKDKVNGVQDHIVYVTNVCHFGTNPDDVKDILQTAHVITTRNDSCSIIKEENNGLKRSEGVKPGHTLLDRLRDSIMLKDFGHMKYVIIKRDDAILSQIGQFRDTVYLDPTVGPNTMFVFHYKSADAPEVEITSPSGNSYTTKDFTCFKDEGIKLIRFFFEHAESGEWGYTITSKDIENGVSVMVSSTAAHTEHDPIIIRTLVDRHPSHYNQIALHVDVTKGSHPVVGLSVTVNIETPSGVTDELQLFDNGAGADTAKNDGIYSRFYIKANNQGTYHITAHVKGEEGQVFTLEETVKFPGVAEDRQDDDVPYRKVVDKRSVKGLVQRHVTMDSIFQPMTLVEDVIPPARIVDLTVVKHLRYRNTLALKWTAPGNDLDHGKLHTYELLIGENIKDVRKLLQYPDSLKYEGPGRIVVENYVPVAMATETEVLLWSIHRDVTTFAFSVRGIDEAGNTAELSNVATFGFPPKT